MACRAIHSWTFSSLLGAFLDLSLAYLMLCGSALAFFAAKFLGIFGLHLPCPCNGLFGNPGGNCLQGVLVDCPPRAIASVQMSVRSRFPFDSIWADSHGGGTCPSFDIKFVRDGRAGHGVLEMEREESCGSVSSVPKLQNLNLDDDPSSGSKRAGLELVSSAGTGVRGKGVLNPKPRSGLRRRYRAAVRQTKSSSVLSCDPPQLVWQRGHRAPYGPGKQQQEMSEENSTPSNSGGHHLLPDNVESAGMIASVEGTIPDVESKWQHGNLNAEQKYTLPCCGDVQEFDRNEANTIRILEQALEEEQTARFGLYAELEKERSAAASAADEAMAMILRLQKEKASIEMEARQYQRMIEEKSAYDEEEMDILKEIIVRREREKYVLEKEVEMCRQMMLSGVMNKHQSVDELPEVVHMIERRAHSSCESANDPALMLQQICESIGKKETMSDTNGFPDAAPSAIEKQNSSGGYGKEQPELGLAEETCFLKPGGVETAQTSDKHYLEAPYCTDESSMDFQEKGMVSVDVYPSLAQIQMSSHENGSDLCKLNVRHEFHPRNFFVSNENRENDRKIEIGFPCDHASWVNDQGKGESGCESYTSQSESESIVHDVHVIDDKFKLCRDGNGKETDLSQVGSASVCSKKDELRFEPAGIRNIGILSDNNSSASCKEAEPKIHKSSSDMTMIVISKDSSHGEASHYNLRRNSVSAVDNERLKLETEVECLRERLKVVQQGREKLNFSMEYREKENLQLQLLEEIALQLREIRQLSEPGKAIRQASLPPPSSKVNTKKRRCRSVSSGVHGISLNH